MYTILTSYIDGNLCAENISNYSRHGNRIRCRKRTVFLFKG